MGFSRQEYWSGFLPFPLPGDLSDPGVKPVSHVYLHWPEASLPVSPPGKPTVYYISNLNENLQ